MAFHIFIRKTILIASVALTLMSCGKQELKTPQEYKGPLREAEDVEMFYTEDERVKVKMNAKLVYEYQNGDREFPKGIYLEFYTPEGAIESTLKANEAYFFKEQNQWRGRGDVQVKNIAKQEQLNTEELFWKPADEKIFTDKFVTIRQEGDVIYGNGLDAKQDMSDYTIIEPYGEMDVKEEN
jgi:LPS export ABC transporter protein LptC